MLMGLIVGCIMLVSFVYWCLDVKKGLYAGMTALVSWWAYLLLNCLGINFPMNAAGGCLAGGIALALGLFAGKRFGAFFTKGGLRGEMICYAALSFSMILYRPFTELVIPGGMILGLGAGYGLCKSYVHFSASSRSGISGAVKYLILATRFLLGIAVFAALFVITEKISGGMSHSANYRLIVFMRYALLALWVSAGAPWLFRFARLAGA